MHRQRNMSTDKVAAIVASLEAEGLLRYPRHRHWFLSWVYESSILQLVALKLQLAFCTKLKTHREELVTPDGGMPVIGASHRHHHIHTLVIVLLTPVVHGQSAIDDNETRCQQSLCD